MKQTQTGCSILNTSKLTGILFALGVGPGDPELVTVKAARILSTINTVFYPVSSIKNKSLALEIAKPYIKADARLFPLSFPMDNDKAVLGYAWSKSAEAVIEKLNEGEDCAFVTLGDPSLYSTFGYLLDSIYAKGRDINVQVVPGIISPVAAADAAKISLASGDDRVAIIPVSTLKTMNELDDYLGRFNTLILMKIGKRMGELKTYLDSKEAHFDILFAKKIGLEDQKINNCLPDSSEINEGYFSLIILKINN